MANTYQLISSNVLSSAAASVTFSSIPATYTDLVLRMSVRSTGTSTDRIVTLKYNNDTTSTYSWTTLLGNGSTASSGGASSTGGAYAYSATASGATANTFGSLEVYIPSYTASQNKPISVFGMPETNATTFSVNGGGAVAQLFSSTIAISRIDITTSGQIDAGSSFYLYGIKNS